MNSVRDQKLRSHAKIVRAASQLFRRRGYRATSVDVLMNEAGLTRGGFYAHFENKAALLRTALQDAFAESRANLFERGLDGVEGDAWLVRAAARYLRRGHVEQPERGCAIPSLAAEVASRGITVNCVAPGFISTAMTDKLPDAQKEKLLGAIPAGRMGDANEIAASVAFLASPEASYVTGATLHVNGGMAMI